MRMIAVFEKSERLRYVGHLDLMRTMQRALRRSGLPISYSKGFNPHIQVAFASALSVGAVGRRELMDVEMEAETDSGTFLAAMNRALPPEMQLSEARAVDDRHPALMASMQAAGYRLELEDPEAAAALAGSLEAFLAQESIPAQRKTKSGMKDCDIRPLIHALTMEDQALHAVLIQTERESCKPDMLMKALFAFAGTGESPYRVIRLQLYGRDGSGELQPLECL